MRDSGGQTHWRSHLRRWWKIDVLTLGLGMSFAWLAWRRFPDTASFVDALLPNLASEFLGVWLGVRIIDYLISNNEEHHRIRRNVLNVVEASVELSRKILIKFDVVFLEEFKSRRALGDRTYRTKPKRFSESELIDFGAWIDWGNTFEGVARTYFRQVGDLRTIQGGLPGWLGDHDEAITNAQVEAQAQAAGEDLFSLDLIPQVPTTQLLQEPWYFKLANIINDFIHHQGRPSMISGPNSISSLLREAQKRVATADPEVQQIFENWFAEIRNLIGLRIEFDAAFEEFNHISEKLMTDILEETDE